MSFVTRALPRASVNGPVGLRHGHADRLAGNGLVVDCGIKIVFAVALGDVAGPGIAPGPLEGRKLHRRTVVLPGFHIARGIHAPFIHDVILAIGLGFVVADIQVHAALVD
jgi:hypothetical protein